MKTSAVRIIFITTILVAASVGAVAISLSNFKIKPGHSVLKSFEYMGCDGDWDEDSSAPSIWKKQEAGSLIVLTKYAETCGYDRANDPSARLVNNKLLLDYTLDTSSGILAACICQYWAKFEISSSATKATIIEVHGKKTTQHSAWPRGR